MGGRGQSPHPRPRRKTTILGHDPRPQSGCRGRYTGRLVGTGSTPSPGPPASACPGTAPVAMEPPRGDRRHARRGRARARVRRLARAAARRHADRRRQRLGADRGTGAIAAREAIPRARKRPGALHGRREALAREAESGRRRRRLGRRGRGGSAPGPGLRAAPWPEAPRRSRLRGRGRPDEPCLPVRGRRLHGQVRARGRRRERRAVAGASRLGAGDRARPERAPARSGCCGEGLRPGAHGSLPPAGSGSAQGRPRTAVDPRSRGGEGEGRDGAVGTRRRRVRTGTLASHRRQDRPAPRAARATGTRN